MRTTLRILLSVFLLSHTALAGGVTFGIGVVGGLDFPLVQDDQSQGSIFGFKGRVQVIPAIALEPNIYFTKFGDPDPPLDIEGSKVTAYGLDVTLGAAVGGVGIKPYGLFGAGFYSTSTKTKEGIANPYEEGEGADFGWSAGFGIEVGLSTAASLDFRGKLIVIPTEGGGSKKSASVTGGLNYYFGR